MKLQYGDHLRITIGIIMVTAWSIFAVGVWV